MTGDVIESRVDLKERFLRQDVLCLNTPVQKPDEVVVERKEIRKGLWLVHKRLSKTNLSECQVNEVIDLVSRLGSISHDIAAANEGKSTTKDQTMASLLLNI